MKSLLAILFLTLSVIITSCIRNNTDTDRIYIKGSDTMYLLMQRLSAAYMYKHPGTSIYVNGGGTAAGFEALNSGEADICMASRDLQADEVKRLAQNHMKIGMSYLIAKDAISIYLNPNIQITDFTTDEIKDIFTGKITNWKDIDGRDIEITSIIRNSKSGTNAYFRQTVLDNEEFASNSVIKNTTKQVIDAVSSIDGAIGFGGIAFRGFVTFAKINGVYPTKETIKNDEYELIRYLHLYTVKSPEGKVRDFINWTMSDEAQKIISEFGYFSLW